MSNTSVKVDLHLHTIQSDGNLSPAELVKLASEKNLEIISITDHDITAGLAEAYESIKDNPHLTLIPGVELSTDIPGNEIHMLGYYMDYSDLFFQKTLERFRDGRVDRARQMVRKLEKLGMPIDWDRVVEIAGEGAIGRPHIAAALVESGYVEYPKDAFDKYIGRNGIAYVERVRVTPVEAVEILVKNGAMPVMAHPTYYSDRSQANDFSDLKSALFELKEAGLVGMEVHYKDYSPSLIMELQNIAGELELIPCGGTDYHASGNPDEPLPGFVGPPMETITRLNTLKSKISDN